MVIHNFSPRFLCVSSMRRRILCKSVKMTQIAFITFPCYKSLNFYCNLWGALTGHITMIPCVLGSFSGSRGNACGAPHLLCMPTYKWAQQCVEKSDHPTIVRPIFRRSDTTNGDTPPVALAQFVLYLIKGVHHFILYFITL